jgi:hypothetical protein
MMKEYVKGNITHDASSSVKYFVKMLAQASETAIFFFLGYFQEALKSFQTIATTLPVIKIELPLILRGSGL